MADLKTELAAVLNRASRENESNTPDFILAEYLVSSLALFEASTRQRERWYGKYLVPANGPDPVWAVVP